MNYLCDFCGLLKSDLLLFIHLMNKSHKAAEVQIETSANYFDQFKRLRKFLFPTNLLFPK